VKHGDRVIVRGHPGVIASEEQGKPDDRRQFVRYDSGNSAWVPVVDIEPEVSDA
jgi:hypothetical protein